MRVEQRGYGPFFVYMPLPRFPSNSKAAEFLKTAKVGDECITESTTKRAVSVRVDLHNFGLRTSVTGSPGNWTLKLVSAYDPELERERSGLMERYYGRKSETADNAFPTTLKVGESAMLRGINIKTIRNSVAKVYGVWTCTLNKLDDGWLLTRRCETKDQKLIETFKPKKVISEWVPPAPTYASKKAKRTAATLRNRRRKAAAKRAAKKAETDST